MLRRAGLHRQHLELFGVLGRSSEFRVLSRASQFSTRWTGSTAAAPRPKSRHSGTPQTSRSTELAPRATLPPDLIVTINDLLSHNVDNASILKDIRASPNLFRHLTNPDTTRKLAEGLAVTCQPPSSLRLLSLAHSLGCNLKHNAYECLAFHFAKKKLWNGVLSAVRLAKQHLGRPTSRLLNWRARALVETEDYSGLQGLLGEFSERCLVPNRRTFHLILSGNIRNRNLIMAKQCLVTMTEAGYPPDASTHAIVATHYRRLGMDPQVESRSLEALPDVKSTTATAVLNSLMQLRLDAHDLPGALHLLTLFHRNDSILAVMTDGKGLSNTGHTLNPNIQIRQNLFPNAATFSIFINYQASQSNLSGALRIFRNMLAAGIQPTTATITSLIHAFFAVGQGDVAVRMVAKMCDDDTVHPSMFKPILSSQTNDGLPWVPSGLLPTIQVFNALLRGVLRTHGVRSTDTVLRIVHASNLRPTAATLEILLAHLNTVERSHPAVLLRLLRQLSFSDIQPNLRHMHIIMSSVLRREKYLLHGRGWDTTAVKFSTRRKKSEHHYPENRISAEAHTFDPTAGIALPRTLSHRRHARSIIESLLARKVLSDAPMVSLRIRQDALIKSDVDSAKEIFHTLLDRGMNPNEYHYSALMDGLVKSGDVGGALDVMRSASLAGVKPNLVMFTIIIDGHARQGKPDRAMQVFQDMLSAGIMPDVPSIDAVAGAFFAVGAYNMAKKVLTSLWGYIEPFPEELRNARLETLACAFRSLHDKNRHGFKTPSKRQRLLLHLELNRLRDIWKTGSTKRRKSSTR
ncbi:hypothetical protein D9615_005310 [Tricholomella constricta]|uniref:Pentatricopeptide repeat-containing protein n=1 Tax=Tricholomella constricta TaxID=117010 RepID=A0A8H5H6K5_9AGAR|nr:hypothetical protein D9615_005310 [Tricholomella constricta]